MAEEEKEYESESLLPDDEKEGSHIYIMLLIVSYTYKLCNGVCNTYAFVDNMTDYHHQYQLLSIYNYIYNYI